MLVSVYVRHLAAVYTGGILSSSSLWYSSELCVRIGRRWLALISYEALGRVRPVKIITSERRTAKLENTLKGLGKLEKNGCYISQNVHNSCVVNT